MAQEAVLVHLVHNDSDVLLSLYELLSACGFQVAASSNSLEGLAYIARSKPRAILCRWEMPEMEGPEFIRRAKAMSPESRIILCSRDADGEKYKQVVRMGGADLLPEPISASAVREAMMRSIGLGVPYEQPDVANSYDLDSTILNTRNEDAAG